MISEKTGPIGRLFQVEGIEAFVDDAATFELLAGGLREVHSFSVTAIGTPAADEQLSINETVTDGVMVVPTGGKITVTRTGAAKTADLAFSFILRGV